jgi:hypothetical protein
MPVYTETATDTFTYANDWLELVEPASPSSSNSSLSNDAQEAVVVGLVPWNKQRGCARFFLGYYEAQSSSPWKLLRTNPKAHPHFPWLYAHDVSFSPWVTRSNSLATNNAPKRSGVFDANLEEAYHFYCVATVRYRNYRHRFVSDGAISVGADEWKRHTFFDGEPSIEALQVTGGGAQLVFAEGALGNPSGKKFPAPVAQLLAKNKIICHWSDVPWEYLSVGEYIFEPSKILRYVGTVNSEPMFSDGGFSRPAGTLLFQPPRWTVKQAPIVYADTNNTPVTTKSLRYVDLVLQWDYFNPERGVFDIYFGHNMFPWGGEGATVGDGKFYFATRDGLKTGVLTTENTIIKYADHRKVFEHVLQP